MTGFGIPRFLRDALIEDPDEEAKLAAFRARAFGTGAASDDGSVYFGRPLELSLAAVSSGPDTEGGPGAPYLDYSRAVPRPNPRPLPEPPFAHMPTEGPLGPYLDYSNAFPRPNPKPLSEPRFADMPVDGPQGPATMNPHLFSKPTAAQLANKQRVSDGLRFFANETVGQATAGVSEAVHNSLRALPGAEELEKYIGYQEPNFAKPETAAGMLIRDTARFLTGFLPAVRVLRMVGAGGTAAATAAAAVSEAFTKNPLEENLVDLLDKHVELRKPIYGYLSEVAGLDPSDINGFKRAENALIGALVGGPLDYFLGHKVARVVKLLGISRHAGVTLEGLVIDGLMGAAHTATEKSIHNATPHSDEPHRSSGATP